MLSKWRRRVPVHKWVKDAPEGRGRRRAGALVLLSALVAAGSCTAAGNTASEGALAVRAKPVTLLENDRERTTAGQLRWLAGFTLSADNDRFGGLSGLLIAPDGTQMTAVSDAGTRFTLTLEHDARGVLTGVGAARLEPLLDLEGRVPETKGEADAESLAPAPGGGVVVAFEQRHRLWLYRGTGPEPIPRPLPEPIRTSPWMARLPHNRGIEALARLGDGRLLAIAEACRDGEAPAWLRRTDGIWARLAYRCRDRYRPTGATRLPGGGILVLERYFSPLGGLAARLRVIDDADARHGATLDGRLIAELVPPLTVDNMEGVAARRGPDGATLVYLVSDDNFNGLQRTLLLQFRFADRPR
jgi:hypothetical protein